MGLKYIHDNDIIHADMKPHNILYHRNEDSELPLVKICDFGISLKINKAETGSKKTLMKQRSGTAGYIAPEVKANGVMVGREIDMWAMGVIVYEMCVGYKPTQVKNYMYGTGDIPFRPRDWRHLKEKGKYAQDFVLKCLQLDPEKRITVEEALNHEFLVDSI